MCVSVRVSADDVVKKKPHKLHAFAAVDLQHGLRSLWPCWMTSWKESICGQWWQPLTRLRVSFAVSCSDVPKLVDAAQFMCVEGLSELW